MNGQGPVQSIPLEQQLAKLEPLDTVRPTNEKSIARFSGKEVKIALLTSLPFLLAGLLTVLTSLFLPLGLAFGLATAGYFAAGTIISAAIFCKKLADRKAQARSADSVLPFIKLPPLQNISGSSPSPSYPSQTYRTPAASRAKQEFPSFPLPNQKPHPPAASDQKSPLNQRSLPAQVDALPDNLRSQANTTNYPQISGSAATNRWMPPHSDSLPEPVRPYFRGINQPAISHQADIKSEKSIDTSDVRADKSFEEAIADAILESLLREIATSNLAETADSISDEASLSGDSAFDVSSTSSQSERDFSSDYSSTSDSNDQSESENNDDAPSDLSINTLATPSISLPDNRQTATSDSGSLRVRAINQLHDSGDQRERSHSSHSTDEPASSTMADDYQPAKLNQKSTGQQIDAHNLIQIDDDSFVLETDIDTALPVESSEPSLTEQSFLPDDNSLATTDNLWQPESDSDNYDASPDSSVNTFTTTSSALLHDQEEPETHDRIGLPASAVDQNYDSGDQSELPNLSLSHSAGDQKDILPSGTTEDSGHLANQPQISSGQQATIHDLTHFDDDSLPLEEDANSRAPSLEIREPSPVLEKASAERQQSDISEDFGLPETFEEPLINDDRDEEKLSADEELSVSSSGLPSRVVQTAPTTQTSLSMASLDNTAPEASRKAENDGLQTEKKRTVKREIKVSPKTELPLYKTPASLRLGSNSRRAGDSELTKQFLNKIASGKNKSPTAKKAEPESITRKAVPLSGVPLQEVTHKNSSARLSKPLTLQKQSEKKAISDTSEKEAKVAFQSTNTHTLSAPDQQTGKRVPAPVSDSPTVLSEKSVTESRTSTALVRASERQVAPTDHNINDLSPLADGKALYFNIQATDIGSRHQLRLTPNNPDQDSIRPPAFLLKIEEGLMPTATREHSSSALAVPARTHRHLKVTILINRDNPSSSTTITINRQVTPEVFAMLDAQLHKSGTCDLTIDKNQLSALQLEKLFALEGASTLNEPGKITEIDATEHLLETTSDSDLFTSIPETSTETSVEFFAYDNQPGQPKKAHSQPILSKLEPVRVTDNTEYPVSKQSMIYTGLPEDALPVSSHSMMATDKQVTIEELQPLEAEAIIHGGFGNLEEILSKSRPKSMSLIPEVQHNEELFDLTDKSRKLLHTSSFSPMIVTPDRVVGRQRSNKLTAHVSIKSDSAEMKAFDNSQSTSIYSDEHEIPASNVLDKTESSSPLPSKQEDPARASTPIEKRLLPVEDAHISHTFKAPKGNVTEPAPILSDKTVLTQSPSLAHEQTLNVTAETGSVSTNSENMLNVRKRAASESPGSDDITPKQAKNDLSTFNENRAAETIEETPDHQLPDAINAIVTEQATTHSAPSDEMAASQRPTMALEQPLNVTIETIDPVPELELSEAVQATVTEFYESKQPVADVLPILTAPITDIGKLPVPVIQTQADEQADIYESKAAKAIESHTPTDDDRGEETPSSLIVSLANDDTYSLPESDLVSGVYTATGQSHSLPIFTGARQPSPVRRAFSLDKQNYGHLADTEYSSSDTSPLLSPTGSDFGLANQQTNIFSGADNAAPNQPGAMTPHSFDPAVSKNKTGLDDKHKRVRGHASDPELTTQRKERLSGGTTPEKIAHHLPELSDFSSFGSFCIIDVQEVSEPDSIDDSYMDDWEDLIPFAQELKPFKQELEDAINKPLVLLEYLAHQLAYNLDGKTQVELPDHSDGNQRYNVQKVKEVPPGLNAYILYPENTDTEKPVDLKLIFRGTNPYDASAIRDLEPSGAGFDTMEKAAKIITRQLHDILEHYPDRAINLTITGHSLGGADAQNFFGHFLNPDISAITNETLTANPLLANIQKIVLFTKCSAGVPEITHNRVISALNRLNGQQEQTGIKTEIFHLKVEGDIVQATGDCHVGSSLEQELADVSILQIYPSNEASRVDRHTKMFFTDDANLAPIYWYKWMKNTTDKGMEDIRFSVRDTSRILRSYPIKGAQWAIHSAANYWFTPSEAMTEVAVLKDTTIAEQPEASTPFTSIRTESDDISASNPASLITHSTAETLKEEQKNEGSEVHLEDITPIKTMGYANESESESDSDQASDVEHSPLPTIWLPRGRKQKKSRLQKIIPHQLRKRPDSNLEITRAYDGSICYRLGLCGNKETKRKDIKPYDRDNNIKIEFIRRMLGDEQSFVRACDPYNVIRDINADIEEEAKAKERFHYGILAKAEVTDKTLKGEAFRDATRPVTERAYWNFIARCQYDHSDTLDEEIESNKGAFKYSFQLIHKLACFNNEFGQIEHNFNQFLFKKELSTDDQKRLRSLLKRAGTLQKHAESCYQDCEKYNLVQKTIENILSKAVGSDSQNCQCQKLQKIQEGIREKLNEKPQSDTPEVHQEVVVSDNEPLGITTSPLCPDLQSENTHLADAHDIGLSVADTDIRSEVDDVISCTSDMSFDLSSDDHLLSEDENDPEKQPDSLTDEQKLNFIKNQDSMELQHLSLTDDDKLALSSAEIPSATCMSSLYTDAQKVLDEIHAQGKLKTNANELITDVSRYISAIQELFSIDTFSLQAPPADAVRDKMYSQLVDLGARYLIVKTGAEEASDNKDSKKVQLAKCTEFLWQTQQAWESASPDLVNGQVGAMLAIGLMRPEQKAFVFEVCLNTQIISLEDIRRNIKQLKDKQQELSLNLQDKTPDSEGYKDLTKRLVNIQQELSNFENQYSDLKTKESSGMKSQKDFLNDCYSQLSKKLQDDVAAGVKRYLNKYKDTGSELKKVKYLSESVVSESGPMLRKKSREYAKENSRRKSNDKQGIKWQQVKEERFTTLRKSIQTIIEKEIIHQLCSDGRHEVAHQLFRIDEEMISQFFGVQKLAYTEEQLNVIDDPMYQIYLQDEIRSLTTPKTREFNNHQMILDIERPGFACNVRKSDDTVLTFDHPNSFCKEWSQLSAPEKKGNKVPDDSKKRHAAEVVLKQLTDSFYDVLHEAGIEDKERTNHLVNIMLAHSHQGAYALSMAVSKTVQSDISKEVKPYLPLAPHIPENLIPDPLVKEKGQSRWNHAEFSVSKDKKSMLLKKVFEWNIELHDKELNIIPGTTRRMRVETVFEIGLHNNCATTKSINVSEVERGRVS